MKIGDVVLCRFESLNVHYGQYNVLDFDRLGVKLKAAEGKSFYALVEDCIILKTDECKTFAKFGAARARLILIDEKLNKKLDSYF